MKILFFLALCCLAYFGQLDNGCLIVPFIMLETGGTYAAAYMQKQNSKKTLAAQREAQDKELATEERINKENREALQPFTELGYKATSSISDLMGYNGEEKRVAALNSFRTDPGYKFSTDEMTKATTRSALAKGNLFSGKFATDLQDRAGSLADQQYSNYYGRLFNQANMGRGTAVGVADMNTRYGDTLAGIYRQGAQDTGAYYTGLSDSAKWLANNQQQAVYKTVDTISKMYGGKGWGGGGAS